MLKSAEVDDRIGLAAQNVYEALIDAEAAETIGAGRLERTVARMAMRNGLRPGVVDYGGEFGVADPQVAFGVVFPELVGAAPADRSGAVRGGDGGLFAYGVSTRKVDDLVKALGADTGISRSQVSWICADLDEEVAAFRDRSLEQTTYPYVFVDATYCKARVNHRVVSQAIVVAVGVSADGRREVLGMDVGDSEDGAFWTAFLRSLKARQLSGVQLVISDAHAGLKQAIAAVFLGASWQRCRVHFMRNVLAVVPKGNADMVAAAIRPIFAQPDGPHVLEQFEVITATLGRQLPKAETMMRDAKEDLLAFTAFPQAHWRQIWSTNPLERTNKEIKRRTDVVGVFPNPEALLRLAGSALIEQHDEWAASDRRYFSERSMALLTEPPTPADKGQVMPPELKTAWSDH